MAFVSVAPGAMAHPAGDGGLPSAGALRGLSAGCSDATKFGGVEQQLLRNAEREPSARNLSAVGAGFAVAKNYSCAIEAFRASLALDPKAWKTRHDLAIAYVQVGNLDLAASEFRKVIEEQPDSYIAHNGLGLVLERAGRLNQAVDEFKAATELKPSFTFAWLNLAEVSLELKWYDAAEVYLQKALAMSPPQEIERRLRLDLGIAYSESGDYAKAADVFTRLIAEDGNSSQAHFDYATSLAHELRYAEAAKEYKRAWELDPANADAELSMLKSMLLTEDAGAALPFAAQYVQAHPHDAAGFAVQGQLFRKLGRDKDALPALQRALQLDPANYDARYNLGMALSRTGSAGEAILQLKEALRLHPDSEEAAYALGMLYAKAKNQQAARQYLDLVQQSKASKDDKERAGVLNNEANADLQAHRYDKAAVLYKQVLALDPSNAQWHYNYALALDALGMVHEEEGELRRALQLNQNSAKNHNQYGLCLQRLNKPIAAERQFQQALQLDPEYAEAQNNLGILYARRGSTDEAIRMLQKSILENPRYTDAYVNLGIVYANQAKLFEAEQQFRSAISQSPAQSDAYTGLGEVKVREGHLDQAIPLFKKVVDLQPESAAAHMNLGMALADSWDMNAAVEQFKDAVKLDANSPDAHYHLGRVLAKLDRLSEALPELETACRLEPDSPSALYSLALVLRKQRDLSRSTELLERVIKIAPTYPGAQTVLARNLADAGKKHEAIEHWGLALKLDPNDTAALFGMGHALSKTDPADSARYLARFSSLQKDEQLLDRVRTLGNLGIKAAASKEWANAVALYGEALRLCGECSLSESLHRNLGLIYGQKGDVKQAESELRDALKLNPEDPDALEAVKALAQRHD